MDHPVSPKQNLPQAGPKARIILTILFLLVCLTCSALIVDYVTTDSILSGNTAEIDAEIITKHEAHSKTGYRYYIDYRFSVEGKDYSRAGFFGVFHHDTRIEKQKYDILEVGMKIRVIYSLNNPGYNKPILQEYEDRKISWLILGIIIFGIISVNEIRIFLKQKTNNK